MFKDNRNLLIGIISMVIVTFVLTFAGSALFFTKFYNIDGYGISNNDKSGSIENSKKFRDVKALLKNNYYEKVDDNTLLEGAIAGMADSLKDPYTVYFTKEQMKSFMEKSEGSYVGIGISITLDKDGLVTVLETFEDSPARKAGIVRGDKFIKVNDKDVTALRDEEMVVKMIKGKENTEVKVTVYRTSDGKTYDYTLKRKKIKFINITSEMLPQNIGYIRIASFDHEIAKYFGEHLNALLNKGMKSLVVDVRDNPGGSLEQVIAIADRLLPKGMILYTEDKYGKKEKELSDAKELGLPLALLTNGNSASASECLAGAVKDHQKGVLVGTKTFGKGIVQRVWPLEDGAGIKITIARYFTPSGVCIQGLGIEPNVKVEPLEKYKDYPASRIPREDDVQLKKAVEILKEKMK
ncbi:MAG: S41 family peptidase [Clostridia bacterium]|nr:S41 family peptidase [Clostridia bacterium]